MSIYQQTVYGLTYQISRAFMLLTLRNCLDYVLAVTGTASMV
jgi:hypothetical protein